MLAHELFSSRANFRTPRDVPRARSPFAHGPSEVWERRPLVAAIDREKRKLGERLRALRVERGLTQADAAERAGLHAVHIARVESGTANATIATIVAMARAYDVELAALFPPSS